MQFFFFTKELAEAQKIIRRIRKRELYKFADEFIIPPLSVEHFTKVGKIFAFTDFINALPKLGSYHTCKDRAV